MYRSKGCKSIVEIAGDDEEGTHYYVCQHCLKACDVVPVKMSKTKFKKLIKRIKKEY